MQRTASQKTRCCEMYGAPSSLLPCQASDAAENLSGIEEWCRVCFNEAHGASHSKSEFYRMAKDIRYGVFNRCHRPKYLRGLELEARKIFLNLLKGNATR